MWRIGGSVLIERIGGVAGEFIQYPFEMVSTGLDRPTPEEVEAYALTQGQAFLSVLDDSDPAHRTDYGGIVGHVVEFAHQAF